MKIGIDFDNTISNYDKCFLFLSKKYLNLKKKKIKENKNSIKKSILKLKNGNHIWMKIQGKAYGKYIDKALIMNDFLKFLLISKNRKNEIVIVSHKTKFGHLDKEKIPLREGAIEWMKKNKILNSSFSNIKKKSIYFADTREQKIEIISKLKCDYFIDDLFEVLNDTKFPVKTKRILFGNNKNENLLSLQDWDKIINYFYPKLFSSDINEITKFFHKNKYKEIKSIKKNGNSKSFKMGLLNNKNFFIKIYPSNNYDKRNRLINEFDSLKFLSKYKNFNIPKPIKYNSELNVGIFKYIKGKPVLYPSDIDLSLCVQFINDLKKISNKKNIKKFELASETSVNFKNLIEEINTRKKILINNIDKKKYKLIFRDLELIWQKMQIKKIVSKFNSFEKYFILSPSDIGFHNILKCNNKIFFIDFEYFGLDDPIKITSDFIIHPGNNLKTIQIEKWFNSMKNIFSNIDNFEERFNLLFPYFLFRWILIILKILNENYQIQYMQINNINIKKLNEIIFQRISLAKKYIFLLNKIKKSQIITFKDFSYE